MPEEPAAARAPRAGLFRPAAVAAHTEAAGPGRQLPSSRRALDRAAAALAVGLLLALTVGSVVEVNETAEGTWQRRVDGSSVTVVVPVGALARLRAGQLVHLSTPAGPRDATLEGRAEAARAGAGGAAAVARASVAAPMPGDGGKAVVRLDRRRLIGLVGDALGRGFGRG
jgi:hypothetical protein